MGLKKNNGLIHLPIKDTVNDYQLFEELSVKDQQYSIASTFNIKNCQE